MTTKVQYATITENNAGQRLDNFLIGFLKVPKSLVYRIIRKGEVRVNKKRAKPLQKLCLGDEVRIPPVRSQATEETWIPRSSSGMTDSGSSLAVDDACSPPNARKSSSNATQSSSSATQSSSRCLTAGSSRLLEKIIFENDQVIVLNKPPGLAVHGGTGLKGGVIEILRLLRPEQTFMELVHRLDRGTSGCLLIAKSRKALLHLHQQLREGQIKKVYAALVAGHWPKHLNRLEMKLEKTHSIKGHRVKQSESGKHSISTFQVKEKYPDSCLLSVHLYTGRTHQIRVHCSETGHPIIGDDKYGDRAINRAFAKATRKRMCLHSHRIEFNLPDESERFKVCAPIPDEFILND